MTIHSSGQSIFSFIHIEGIILGAGEAAGGASGMSRVRVGKVGGRMAGIGCRGWESRLILMRS